MWIVFSILGFIFYLAYELLAKKRIEKEPKTAPFGIKISVILVGLIAVLIIWLGKFGESGLSPFELIIKYPIIIVSSLMILVAELAYLLALKYIGVSIESSVYGLYGSLLFVAILFVNLVLGQLSAVTSMLQPAKISMIVVLIVSILLLPNIELFFKKNRENSNITKDRKKMVIGIIIVFIAVLMEVCSTIISMIFIGDKKIGAIDYMSTSFLSTSIFIIIFYIVARKKDKSFRIFKKSFIPNYVIALLYIGYSIFYLISMTLSPVNTGIIWVVYPALTVVSSAIFLKERYSTKQYICIGFAIVSSIAFGILDIVM